MVTNVSNKTIPINILDIKLSDYTALRFHLSSKDTQFFNKLGIFTVKDLVEACKNGINMLPVIETVCDILEIIREMGWDGEVLIEELDITSERTYFALKKLNICTIKDYLSLRNSNDSKFQLLQKRIGRKGFENLESCAADFL